MLIQEDEQSSYSQAKIRQFLQDTKGIRLVKVANYFTDLKLFVDSVTRLMMNTGNVEFF